MVGYIKLSWVLDGWYSCIIIWRSIYWILKEANLARGLKMHKSRRTVKVPRTKARHWPMTLVFLQVWEDARIWAHKKKKKKKSLYENIYLKSCFVNFSQTTEWVTNFWCPPWIPFKGCLKFSSCSGHNLIFAEAVCKCKFPVSRAPALGAFHGHCVPWWWKGSFPGLPWWFRW